MCVMIYPQAIKIYMTLHLKNKMSNAMKGVLPHFSCRPFFGFRLTPILHESVHIVSILRYTQIDKPGKLFINH